MVRSTLLISLYQSYLVRRNSFSMEDLSMKKKSKFFLKQLLYLFKLLSHSCTFVAYQLALCLHSARGSKSMEMLLMFRLKVTASKWCSIKHKLSLNSTHKVRNHNLLTLYENGLFFLKS